MLTIWKGSLFADRTNLLEILDQQASYLIIAAAGTMVMIAGGIDLSVGATYALCQVIATKMAEGGNPVLAILVGVLVGVGVGAVNGVIATFFRINSLIATLAMSFVITGVASLVTNGNLIIAYTALGFANFARTQFLDVTTASWTMIGVVIIFGVVLSRTIAGRYMYAAGSNAEAARLAGVRVQWIKLVTFAISGGAAGLGGIIDASRVLSASSANGGTALTFTVLAGIVVGGTSILGGEGAIWRTVVGVLFIAIIGNGFILLGLEPALRADHARRDPAAGGRRRRLVPAPHHLALLLLAVVLHQQGRPAGRRVPRGAVRHQDQLGRLVLRLGDQGARPRRGQRRGLGPDPRLRVHRDRLRHRPRDLRQQLPVRWTFPYVFLAWTALGLIAYLYVRIRTPRSSRPPALGDAPTRTPPQKKPPPSATPAPNHRPQPWPDAHRAEVVQENATNPPPEGTTFALSHL